ncbi:hypothetical protein [Thalassospira xiamenensis]|uniref:hypothetical protein n=1 Tax=Thalassospira xiamenensis TaxID=220697 RepID=UPI000DEE0A7C|nr:hypothetical protein [Thalassospira xiamenensis]RCK40478.1 hypothetical protein TH24_11115 [Thalassospira xiamenensis]
MFSSIGSHTDQDIADEIVDLFALVHEEREGAPPPAQPFEGLFLASSYADAPLKKPSIVLAEAARTKPVQEVARWAVRCVGYQLLERGGVTAMKEVYDRVIEASPRAANWLDHRWSGIGGWIS